MKALVSLSFAIEIDTEDDLVGLGEKIEEANLDAWREALGDRGYDLTDAAELGVEFYGCAITIERDLETA